MDEQLQVIVTGGTSGIGLACVEAFCARGDRVLTTGRRVDRLQRLQDRYPEQVETLAFDVGDREAVAAALGALPRPWDTVDVLVNNAGLALGKQPLHEQPIDDWDRMLQTNVAGLLYASAAILPGMVRRRSGHVINIGSVAGRETYPGGTVYCATKAAVDRITQGMRMDLLGTGVRVTSVDPGMVATEFSTVRFKGDEGSAAAVYEGVTPLSGADVADAVVWAATRPAHVQIAEILIYPTDQASAEKVARRRP